MFFQYYSLSKSTIDIFKESQIDKLISIVSYQKIKTHKLNNETLK